MEKDGFHLGKYRRYKNLDKVAATFGDKQPISAVLLTDGKLYVIMVGQVLFELIQHKGIDVENRYRLAYFTRLLVIHQLT